MSQSDIPSVFPRWIQKLLKMDSGLDQEDAMSLQTRAMWVFLTKHLGETLRHFAYVCVISFCNNNENIRCNVFAVQ